MSTEVLESNVLVLNKLWQVVDVCSAKRAICLLYLNHAKAVVKEGGSFYTFGFTDWRDFSQERLGQGDHVVSTISYTLRIPQVIILMLYDRLPPRQVKFTRKNIYRRDNNTCQYCGRRLRTEDLNLDHVVPLSRGGKNTWENVVCSCIRCNMKKGSKTLKEARMRLIRKPKRPSWKTFVKNSFPINPNNPRWESWKEFLDMAYWNVELEE